MAPYDRDHYHRSTADDLGQRVGAVLTNALTTAELVALRRPLLTWPHTRGGDAEDDGDHQDRQASD